MKPSADVHAALDARDAHKAPQRFAAEPITPSAFATLDGAVSAKLDADHTDALRSIKRPRIGGREVTVERVGILPPGTAVEWCACFRWNDIGDPQGYGHTCEEALVDLAEAWAEQIGDPAHIDPIEPREWA